MKQLHIILRGTLPLLQHNIRSMTQNPDRIPSDEEAAKLSSYTFPDGSLCMPAAAVRNALLKAAAGKRGKEEWSKRTMLLTPLLSGAVLLADDFFPLVDSDGNPIREYTIDIRSVKNPTTRGRFPRIRPRIDPPWFLVCTFNYNDIVAVETIEEILGIAGATIGIGDYRLEKRGPFGGFEVAEINVK